MQFLLYGLFPHKIAQDGEQDARYRTKRWQKLMMQDYKSHGSLPD